MKLILSGLLLVIALCSLTCNKESKSTSSPISTVPEKPTYRPAFHFAPKKNWHNDPNGLVFYKTNYHLFFQYNPYGEKWGHMSWGHATSKDLMRWIEEPVALFEYPAQDGSNTMAFSGTAVVDSMNTSRLGNDSSNAPMVLVYTSSSAAGLQHQSVAYTTDGLNFTRYINNPVLDVGYKDFRDPKVFWHHDSNKWIMIVSKALEYKLEFYSSPDLKTWTYMSAFGSIGNVSRIWECPDIFELPVENEQGIKKWIVTISAGHPQNGHLAMQYFIGSFDGTSFTPDQLNYPRYLDEGKDFYAGIIYNNLPDNDKRKIMIGWANSWEYANDIPTVGFRGSMGIPRELTLYKNKEGYIIKQKPIAELDNYLDEVLFQKNVMDVNGIETTDVKADVLEMQFTISRGTYGRAGVTILKNDNESTTIYFNPVENKVFLDRTKSGNTTFSNRFSSVESVDVSADLQYISFRMLVDKSIVELFVNDGEKVISDRVFPYKKEGAIEFFSEGGAASFKDVKIRKVKPAMNP